MKFWKIWGIQVMGGHGPLPNALAHFASLAFFAVSVHSALLQRITFLLNFPQMNGINKERHIFTKEQAWRGHQDANGLVPLQLPEDLKIKKKESFLSARDTYTVIRFLWVSSKFGTCTVVSVYGTLVEDKMHRFQGEYTHFSFSKCHIYTHDGASACFGTNTHEADNSVRSEW